VSCEDETIIEERFLVFRDWSEKVMSLSISITEAVIPMSDVAKEEEEEENS